MPRLVTTVVRAASRSEGFPSNGVEWLHSLFTFPWFELKQPLFFCFELKAKLFMKQYQPISIQKVAQWCSCCRKKENKKTSSKTFKRPQLEVLHNPADLRASLRLSVYQMEIIYYLYTHTFYTVHSFIQISNNKSLASCQLTAPLNFFHGFSKKTSELLPHAQHLLRWR